MNTFRNWLISGKTVSMLITNRKDSFHHSHQKTCRRLLSVANLTADLFITKKFHQHGFCCTC